MKYFFSLSVTVMSLILVSIAWRAEGNAPGKTCMVTLYARETEVQVGLGSRVVIEIQNFSNHDMEILGSVGLEREKIESGASLPTEDPSSDATGGYCVILTSYVSSDAAVLAVQDHMVPPDYTLGSDKSYLFPVDVPPKLIGVGSNRLRVSIYEKGKFLVSSNVISIKGSPNPATKAESRYDRGGKD